MASSPFCEPSWFPLFFLTLMFSSIFPLVSKSWRCR
jgi:hypothetical protein